MIIRLMQPDDELVIRRLVMRYLKDTYTQGGDFLPTIENASAFTAQAIQAAADGDPCLVSIDDDGKIVGFVIAQGVFFPGMQTRDITIRSWGTYVLPEYRQKRYAIKLIMVMGRLAKQKGYTRFLGVTQGSGYTDNAMRLINSVAGMQEIGKVIMWNLRTPTRPVEKETTISNEFVVQANDYGSLVPE